jgi:type II secretory pathway pseudopilin PulG
MAVISPNQRISAIKEARSRRLDLPRYLKLSGGHYLLGLVVILCLTSLIALAQTGVVATKGYAIVDLQAERTVLLRERTQLQARQAVAQSLEQIRSRADALGLRPTTPDQVRYIDIVVADERTAPPKAP